MNKNCRAVAAQILFKVVHEQQSLTPLLAAAQSQVEEKDQGLLQALCFGVCRHYHGINALSKIMLDKPLPEKSAVIQSLIWVGLFQLAYSKISEHAAINETVNAAEQMGFGNMKGVVNAILRRFQREKDALLEGLNSSDVTRLNHPKWLIKLLKKEWPNHWQTICEQANLHPPMNIRVNTHKLTRNEYSLLMKGLGIKHFACELSQFGLRLDNPVGVNSLPGFNEGHASVQDEAAQLAAQILQPQANEKILDACSAPGGKTGHLLEVSKGLAQVTAMDADERRLQRVHENLERLGYQAKCLVGEAQHPKTWWDGDLFDRILLDVPCSATGVIRRHPDIKLLRQKEDIAKLAALQAEILEKAWGMLKPGGQLLYATCSILPAENADNIALFLQSQTDAKLLPLNDKVSNLKESSYTTDTGFGWQFFPNQNGHDGFFYALLEKTA